MPQDYYAVLGVSRVADPATIHSAFRALARQYHPDAGSGSSTSKFREVLEAYHTLSDPRRRRQHDIDLGEQTRLQNTMAEPLFDPARSRNATPLPSISGGLNEAMSSMLRAILSEIALVSREFF